MSYRGGTLLDPPICLEALCKCRSTLFVYREEGEAQNREETGLSSHIRIEPGVLLSIPTVCMLDPSVYKLRPRGLHSVRWDNTVFLSYHASSVCAFSLEGDELGYVKIVLGLKRITKSIKVMVF